MGRIIDCEPSGGVPGAGRINNCEPSGGVPGAGRINNCEPGRNGIANEILSQSKQL